MSRFHYTEAQGMAGIPGMLGTRRKFQDMPAFQVWVVYQGSCFRSGRPPGR